MLTSDILRLLRKKKLSYSPRILRFQPVEQGILVEGCRSRTVTAVALDVGYSVRVLHDFDEPHFVPSGQAAVRDHPVSAGWIEQNLVSVKALLLKRLKCLDEAAPT